VVIAEEGVVMRDVAVRPGARSARMVGAAAGLAGVAVSAAVVWHASYAAFSASTDNPTSNWAAGTVALSDDDSNTALFSANNLRPGATGSRCIAVTSTGSLPATVKLYGTGAATTKALSSYLTLSVTQGSGAGADCANFTPLGSGASVYTGTVAGFAATATGFATGQGSWAPTGAGAETRVFQFSYTLAANTPDTAQGGTAALGFTWEAQNS
jgi:hypothetical protein